MELAALLDRTATKFFLLVAVDEDDCPMIDVVEMSLDSTTWLDEITPLLLVC